MPEHPLHPRFEPSHERSFASQRAKLGLAGENFDHFFRAIENFLGDYPWEYSDEVPNSQGIRMLPTRGGFPDVPPLYVYYRVEENPNKIVFLGLSPAWSREDAVPLSGSQER